MKIMIMTMMMMTTMIINFLFGTMVRIILASIFFLLILRVEKGILLSDNYL